ncbi:hypothetical protein M1B35_30115 [Pseudomonas sp. MAFF 302046]|uniref:Uncharacterized protein n=1 Tax=Pseudomonas morbosilactucae TaxID=2938197 RepID=A0ABT0JRL1_9PSED|nr:hypothetical protein [Pseudomonas morbosilactucae]MCK9818265.1 hypothetical protein [Pseudomonas morbosilactucae]
MQAVVGAWRWSRANAIITPNTSVDTAPMAVARHKAASTSQGSDTCP